MFPGMTLLFFNALIFFARFLQIAIFVRAILTWTRLTRANKIVNFIFIVTEPALAPVREMINKSPFGNREGGMPIDLSPVITFMLLQIIALVLANVAGTLVS